MIRVQEARQEPEWVKLESLQFREGGTAMKTTVTVRIPRYKVTRTGRVVKTGTIIRHVRIKKK